MRPTIRFLLWPSVIVAALCFAPGVNPAYSEGSQFLDETVFGKFTKSDLDLLRVTVKTANDSGEVNKPFEWKNPGSANGGTVTVIAKLGKVKVAEDSELECNRVKFENRSEEKKGEAVFTWCRTEKGVWKILK